MIKALEIFIREYVSLNKIE